MPKKTKSRKKVGVTCQCEEPAVPRPPTMLKQVFCPECGKIFKTNRDSNICFHCQRKRTNKE